MGSGSTSAHATPSLSHSTADMDPVGVDHSAGRTTPADTWSASSSPRGSASASASGTGATGSPTLPGTPANWQTLYQGRSTSTQQAQETADVQTLLNNIGYLQPWRHQTYVLPDYLPYAAGPDADGYYGSATSDAIATFQQYYSIPHSGQLGECDLATYEALIQVIESASSDQTSGSNQTSQATAQPTSTSTAQSDQTPQ
jgi:peptidoglycan hydrolase-like protein with peptidoglycan-binding domain